MDKVTCQFCKKQFSVAGMGYHITNTHCWKVKDYLEKFYQIPNSVVDWREISIKDALYMQSMLASYSKFNNYFDLFQWIYDQEKDLRTLNKKYGYDVTKICICLGIKTDKSLSEKHKRSVSQGHKGKKLSEDHKLRISEGYMNLPESKRKQIGNKISNKLKGHHHSEESILKMIKNRGCPEHAFRGKAGMREDLGHFVRSTWEANFARILNYLKFDYTFEPETFFITKLDGSKVSYTPDFRIGNSLVEVKGYWMDDALEKFNLFKEQYPQLRIHVADKLKYESYQQKFESKVKWE